MSSFFEQIGKGLGTVMSAGSGIFNYFGQKETNQTNEQIARDTNNQNYRIWREQMQYDADKYEKQLENEWAMYNQQVADSDRQWRERFDAQNAYDSPANQRALLEAAGYNPNIYGGDATSSGASSSVSPSMIQPTWNSSPPPTMQGYQYQSPLTGAVDSAMNSLLKFAQAFDTLNNTDANKQNTEAQTGLFNSQMMSQLFTNRMNEKYGDSLLKLDLDIKKENYEFMKEDNKLSLDLKTELIGVKKAEKIGQELSNEAQRIANKYLDGEKQLQLYKSMVDIDNAIKTGYLTEKQAEFYIQQRKESVARTILTYTQNEGAKLDNDSKRIANRQAELLVDQVVWAAKLANWRESTLWDIDKENLNFNRKMHKKQLDTQDYINDDWIQRNNYNRRHGYSQPNIVTGTVRQIMDWFNYR